MVRLLVAAQPLQRQLLAAGRLQSPRGAHAGHEPVEPDAQQRARVIGRRAQRLAAQVDSELGPLRRRQTVHERCHQPRRMVISQCFVQRRRHQPHLLTVPVSPRHRAPPTQSQRRDRTARVRPSRRAKPSSETGSLWLPSPFTATDESIAAPEGAPSAANLDEQPRFGRRLRGAERTDAQEVTIASPSSCSASPAFSSTTTDSIGMISTTLGMRS